MDYAKEYPVAMKAIAEWIEKGLLKRNFHIVNGLDAAPGALPLLYSGGNTGKLCVVFFTLGELVTYFTIPGSLRFPSTKSRLSSKLCDLSTDICCTSISFYVRYNVCVSNLPFAWHPVCMIRVYLQRTHLRQDHEIRPSALGRTQMCSAWFHGETFSTWCMIDSLLSIRLETRYPLGGRNTYSHHQVGQR